MFAGLGRFAAKNFFLLLATEQGLALFSAAVTEIVPGTGRTGTGQKGECADAVGFRRLPGYRISNGSIARSCRARRSARLSRPGGRGAGGGDRGPGFYGRTGERCYEVELYRLEGERIL